MSEDIQNFFKENDNVSIKGFLEPYVAYMFNEYCKNQVRSIDIKSTFFKKDYNEKWDGQFGDPQIPGMTFNKYGDLLFDTLLDVSTPAMQEYTGLELIPNYTYWRFYQKGDILKRHRDRHSCEISTTLCLGYDVSNIDEKTYPDYDWPMFIQTKTGEELPVHMKPGDMIIYRGCIIDHWREKFPGKYHSQVFLHYNDANGEFPSKYDGRPCLGVPLINL
jgi:hypothetical protein